MTPTMSTWCSNQLSYNPTGSTTGIIAWVKQKSKSFFEKKGLILEWGCDTIHPITHLSPAMACAAKRWRIAKGERVERTRRETLWQSFP